MTSDLYLWSPAQQMKIIIHHVQSEYMKYLNNFNEYTLQILPSIFVKTVNENEWK
jgi:hypothetical protein